MNFFEYRGHLHIHSSLSDGSAAVGQIAREASKAGLDFIGITDHNHLQGLKMGLEGRRQGVLVLIGSEIGLEKNHYIAFDISKEVSPNSDNPQQVIDAVEAQGGFGYLAHPTEKGNPLFLDGNCFPWDRWDVKGFCGIEIWNFGSLWRMAYTNIVKAFFWYFFALYRGGCCPDPQTLQLWDSLNKKRPIICFGGSDAHCYPLRLGPFRLPLFPYQFLFRTVNTHLLLEKALAADFFKAREQIYTCLREGRFFIGSDYLHPVRGFRFTAFGEGEEKANMGQEIDFSPSTSLHIKSPSPRGLIRIIKNGRLVYESRKQILAFRILKPGIFRVEVYWRPRLGRPLPWIYSNPIYVRLNRNQKVFSTS